MSPDVVVIGAGTNGLVAAHYLARAGRRVVVLERRAEPARGPEEGWVAPALIRELGLNAEALGIERPDPWLTVAAPGGEPLALWRDPARTAEAIRRLNPADAARWPAFCERMHRLATVLAALYTQPPPDVGARELGEVVRLARLGVRVRRMGRQAIIDLLRVLPMAVAELLDEWFECDLLKGALGAGGIRHLCQGPFSAGTAFVMLHHHVGSAPGVFRPPRSALGAALAGRAAPAGITVRYGAEVRAISVQGGRVAGVVLASGETVRATRVVSNADPRATLLDMVPADWLAPEFVRAVRNIKYRGVAARVTLALERDSPRRTVALAPSLSYLERAYDDAKYGRVSAEPYVEAQVDGRTVVAHVQYAPYALRDGGWSEARRRALGDAVVRRLVAQVPALGGAVTACEVRTPADLEATEGWPEGQRYHGALTLDQVLYMRPVPGWGHYRMPVEGLYLGGPGAHPGGAIAGAAGRHAARAILRSAR